MATTAVAVIIGNVTMTAAAATVAVPVVEAGAHGSTLTQALCLPLGVLYHCPEVRQLTVGADTDATLHQLHRALKATRVNVFHHCTKGIRVNLTRRGRKGCLVMFFVYLLKEQRTKYS